MKKLTFLIAFLFILVSGYAQIYQVTKTPKGKLYFYRGKLDDTTIKLESKQITAGVIGDSVIFKTLYQSITIDAIEYYILEYKKYDDFIQFRCINNGSVKYMVTWDIKHKNILIERVDRWVWIVY